MLAQTVRSGLVESRHPVEVAAVDAHGRVVLRIGELGRPYFARSAVKPVQATVSCELGADLGTQQLAVACASHQAEPVHVAHVRAMLAEVGLGEADLGCPPAWPSGEEARRRVAAAGDRPRSVYHNCSGKHAAMLRTCVAQGWPTVGYLEPGHPLQRRIFDVMADVGGLDPGPVGVDGCGAPTFRITTVGLARVFGRVANDPRFGDAARAMAQYPALTSGTDRLELSVAMAMDAAVKGGAEGCIGVAVLGQYGIAAKADDGSFPAATVGLVAALGELGLVPGHDVVDASRVAVEGGGRRVGWLEAGRS